MKTVILMLQFNSSFCTCREREVRKLSDLPEQVLACKKCWHFIQAHHRSLSSLSRFPEIQLYLAELIGLKSNYSRRNAVQCMYFVKSFDALFHKISLQN